ncbi:MAG: HutD family protein [Arenicella sp.]|jgi:environmental stress-induced protein Ves|nr:HutD family protein [Arenicella sp.]
MPITLLGPSDYVSMPWKNGKGETLELVSAKSADETGFLWRLSIASVVEDGLFSDFTGYERILILLDGNGMTLEHEAGNGRAKAEKNVSALTKKYDYCNFAGESKTQATLHDGPITDFNIMCRRDRFSAPPPEFLDTKSLELTCSDGQYFFYASDSSARWSTSDQAQPQKIPSKHLLCVTHSKGLSLRVEGAGIVFIHLEPKE